MSRNVAFFRPSFLVWVIVPAVLFVAYLIFGLPHMVWSYRFTGSYADLANRTYHRCTYIGPYGVITRPAQQGSCSFIRFFHQSEGERS